MPIIFWPFLKKKQLGKIFLLSKITPILTVQTHTHTHLHMYKICINTHWNIAYRIFKKTVKYGVFQ